MQDLPALGLVLTFSGVLLSCTGARDDEVVRRPPVSVAPRIPDTSAHPDAGTRARLGDAGGPDGGDGGVNPAFDLSWPLKLCALTTSGVPSAVQVDACNCGEDLVCRFQRRADATVLVVQQDPTTMQACTACVISQARCGLAWSLPAGRATVRVNDDVPVELGTDAAGQLVPGQCWDVPRPAGDASHLDEVARRLGARVRSVGP